MKIIIEQEDVGKEIGELGLKLIDNELFHDPLHHIREHQRLQEKDNSILFLSPMARTMKEQHIHDSEQMAGLSDANSVVIGKTPAGANVRIKRSYKKRVKK